MHEYPRIYLGSVAAAARRDVPYFANTTGTVIAGGATGTLGWATSGNRRAWGRIDGSFYDYYEIEALNSTSVRVYSVDRLGELTTADYTVAAGGTYVNLVPGVSIHLHSSLTAGNKARVYPGIFLLDDGSFYIPRGSAGDAVLLAINNPGDVDYLRAYGIVARAAFHENSSGTPLDAVNVTLVNPIADTYAVTISAGTTSGKKVVSVGTYHTYTADNVPLGATDHPLHDLSDTGIVFNLNAAAANGNTATIEVSDFADAIELAPDNGGTPGTWVPWDAVLGVKCPLNRPGYDDKRVPGSQTIYVWIRLNAGDSFNIGRGGARLKVDYTRAE